MIDLVELHECSLAYAKPMREDWLKFGEVYPEYRKILDAIDAGEVIGFAVVDERGRYWGMVALEILAEDKLANIAAMRMRPGAPTPQVVEAMARVVARLGEDYRLVAKSTRPGMPRRMKRLGWVELGSTEGIEETYYALEAR